jgi:hypothetical protein
MLFHWIPLLFVTLWIHLPVVSTKKLWIWTYKSPNIGVKTFRRSGRSPVFTRVWTLNIAFFTLKCLLKRLVIQCSGLNQDEVCSLRTNENKEDSKHQNKHDLWFGFYTEKVVFIFAYIFNIFARKLKIRYQSPNDEKCMELYGATLINQFIHSLFIIYMYLLKLREIACFVSQNAILPKFQ